MAKRKAPISVSQEQTTPLLQINSSIQNQKSSDFYPIYRSKPTGTLASAVGKAEINLDAITKKGIITLGDIVLTISNFDSLKGSISVSTDKLLRHSIATFTQRNSKGNLNDTLVSIPLKEYALLCGYDVNERETNTEEEAEKEALRISNVLRDVRKKINKDLNILYEMSATWDEKINGKSSSFDDIRLVQSKGIRNGYINIRLGSDFAGYLVGCSINQFAVPLLSLDERNSNAYNIGIKMVEHYSIIDNHIKGTERLLRVKTLLGVTTLPTIEKCKQNRMSWIERIKEPLEKALDALKNQGLLDRYDYCYPDSGGDVLLDKDASLLLEEYSQWENTIIFFNFKNPPDLTEAKTTRQTKITKAKQIKEAKLKKSK